MPMCLPTPRIVWARDSSTFTWSYLRYGFSYWIARIAAERAVATAHPATVAGVVAQVAAASPIGCNPNVTQAGPFDTVAHTGWWGGSGTFTRSTEIKGIYTCDKVPPGEIEYK